jgi:hypothetical protein
MKTNELIDEPLDWAVAKCEGATNLQYDTVACWWFTLDGVSRVLSKGWSAKQNFAPSTDWSQGGPIIEREELTLSHSPYDHVFYGRARPWCAEKKGRMEYGQTPLIAAMRCYVASKLGDEVEIPEGLQ